MAAAVQELQNLLPRARVVYCSATGVSEVGNMAFMTRLVGACMWWEYLGLQPCVPVIGLERLMVDKNLEKALAPYAYGKRCSPFFRVLYFRVMVMLTYTTGRHAAGEDRIW